jgi:glutathionylspermidine synthase
MSGFAGLMRLNKYLITNKNEVIEMEFKTVVVEDAVESVKNALQELDKALKDGTGIAFEINIKNIKRRKETIDMLSSKINSKGIRSVMELFNE